MSKINPLFLDSTKPIDDKVSTSVELTHVEVADGNSILLEVVDAFGSLQRFEMRKIITKKMIKFKIEIWLKHQESIRYRFVIEEQGQQISACAYREAKVGNDIREKWEPIVEPKSADVSEIVEKEKANQTNIKGRSSREPKQKAAKDPFGPQFFDKMKSMLDDLL